MVGKQQSKQEKICTEREIIEILPVLLNVALMVTLLTPTSAD